MAWARRHQHLGGKVMVPKDEIYADIARYCKFCRGDTPNDLGCCTGCPLDTYRRPAPRRGEDGLMKPEFRKTYIVSTVCRFCRQVCLNGYSLAMCSCPDCPLHRIAFSRQKHGKDGTFLGEQHRGQLNHCPTRTPSRKGSQVGVFHQIYQH